MSKLEPKTAIIIGAGPAGLTAAYELLKHSDIKPIIFEMSDAVGGISKTINYKGNLLDIGGHRFFSKSNTVIDWWLNIMPLEKSDDRETFITYHNRKKKLAHSLQNKEKKENSFLIRDRHSRIFFKNQLFDYPLKLNFSTFRKLGFIYSIKIVLSYFKSLILPIRNEISLEDFFKNRFGNVLYRTFFKDYTEKVWGVSCKDIPATWGHQRVKGLNILKALKHTLLKIKTKNVLNQKHTETSLIEKFLYPAKGPGQLWNKVAKIIVEKGGEIHYNSKVVDIIHDNFKITQVGVKEPNENTGKIYNCDYLMSTMPVNYLIKGMGNTVPNKIKEVANNLVFRDFITIGVLVSKLKMHEKDAVIKDNWIYIQEPYVKLGRLQIFNNWSPYMVKNKDTIWLGLEYFCNTSDSIWNMTEDNLIAFAIKELENLGIINSDDVLDHTSIKVPKSYPAYFGSYHEFGKIKNYTNRFSNLFLIGRNGMHKYNNQDHSVLSAMAAVDNIIKNKPFKDNIWSINTEEDYHEEK